MTSAADEKNAIPELVACDCNALDAGPFGEVAPLFADDGAGPQTIGTPDTRDRAVARKPGSRGSAAQVRHRRYGPSRLPAIEASPDANDVGVRCVKREWVSQFSRKRLVLDIAGDMLATSRDFPSSPEQISVRNHANANA